MTRAPDIATISPPLLRRLIITVASTQPAETCVATLPSFDRRAFLTLVAGAVGISPAIAGAQPAGKVWRIGFLGSGSSATHESRLVFLEQGLRDLGYTPGTDIFIERRYADGHAERLPRLAAELVRARVDVLVAHGDAALAAKNATATIPVIFVAHPDPVGSGVVASLARPGANVTGSSDLHSDLVAKRLELVKAVMPLASRVAVLRTSAPEMELQFKYIRAAAPALGLTILPIEANAAEGIDRALGTVAKARPDALNVLGTPLFGMNRRRIADFAIAHKLPAISTVRSFADAGFLMSYGADFPDLYRRTATYVDKLLKGARPADLPIEQPTKFELVINLKTAKALGLTVPPSLLQRADQVIE